jgi:hypothetical protein
MMTIQLQSLTVETLNSIRKLCAQWALPTLSAVWTENTLKEFDQWRSARGIDVSQVATLAELRQFLDYVEKEKCK